MINEARVYVEWNGPLQSLEAELAKNPDITINRLPGIFPPEYREDTSYIVDALQADIRNVLSSIGKKLQTIEIFLDIHFGDNGWWMLQKDVAVKYGVLPQWVSFVNKEGLRVLRNDSEFMEKWGKFFL